MEKSWTGTTTGVDTKLYYQYLVSEMETEENPPSNISQTIKLRAFARHSGTFYVQNQECPQKELVQVIQVNVETEAGRWPRVG